MRRHARVDDDLPNLHFRGTSSRASNQTCLSRISDIRQVEPADTRLLVSVTCLLLCYAGTGSHTQKHMLATIFQMPIISQRPGKIKETEATRTRPSCSNAATALQHVGVAPHTKPHKNAEREPLHWPVFTAHSTAGRLTSGAQEPRN